MFCKKGVLRNFAKFTGKQDWDRCCPVNFAKFLRASFFRTLLVAASDNPEDLTQKAMHNRISCLSGIQPDCQLNHFLKAAENLNPMI